ncbi:hypothetical protein EMPS_04197 [Entomortierella parvispora]|uniref:Uncharacterized protein n=1 Tax=Entomortierella parvispora TaxID=205924 RepID=A0A9P3H888_9FUNG|nr:hypothetical protein EMPS_04197 [Entomortierella parvispora]
MVLYTLILVQVYRRNRVTAFSSAHEAPSSSSLAFSVWSVLRVLFTLVVSGFMLFMPINEIDSILAVIRYKKIIAQMRGIDNPHPTAFDTYYFCGPRPSFEEAQTSDIPVMWFRNGCVIRRAPSIVAIFVGFLILVELAWSLAKAHHKNKNDVRPQNIANEVSHPSSPSSAALIFFGIPELTAHVALYLQKRALGRLRLVSKALYYAFPIKLGLTLSPSKLTEGNTLEWNLITGRRHAIRSLTMDLDGFQSSPRQRLFLESLFHHFSGLESRTGLERLQVSYWGGVEKDESARVNLELPVLENILSTLSTIKEVSVIFMASGGLPRWFFKLLTRMCDPHYGPQNCIRSSSSSLNQLTQLNLEARVTSSQTEQVEWSDFLLTLKSLPNLKGLSFTNVTLRPTADAVPILAKDAWCPFVGLKSLKLAYKWLGPDRLLEFHLLFPMLEELQIVDCQGGYSSVLIRSTNEILLAAPSPLSTPGGSAFTEDLVTREPVLFPQLRTLRIASKYPGNHGRLVDLVKGRPHLSDLEADILPFTRSDVYELAEQCSLPAACSSSSKARNRFKRLFIHTDMVTELDEFYSAPCFQQLESVFIQSRQLSMSMFPFAMTLKTLHLGGINELLGVDEERILNDVLLQLTNLEVLILDRYISNYNPFQSFGLDPKTSPPSLSSSLSVSGHVGRAQKRRCLSELSIYLQYPRQERLHTASVFAPIASKTFYAGGSFRPLRDIGLMAFKRTDKSLDLNQLEVQILNRFPGLERLTVHLHAETREPMDADVRTLMSRHSHVEVHIVKRDGDKK